MRHRQQTLAASEYRSASSSSRPSCLREPHVLWLRLLISFTAILLTIAPAVINQSLP